MEKISSKFIDSIRRRLRFQPSEPNQSLRDTRPSVWGFLTFSLVVAFTYLCAGSLGLKLAVPPGYATAVFPPSGIALAAAILLGPRILPAIFLGSAGMNFYINMNAGPLTLTGALLALGIGLGATVQAGVGASLIRKFLPKGLAALDEKGILKFLTLSGPVSCLVNSTISVSLLLVAGVISAPTFSYNWAMWWIGDSIGAMVFAPLVIAAFEGGFFKWNPRKSFLVLPSSLLFTLVVWVFFFSSPRTFLFHIRATNQF